jgi:hypothetical protein
LPYVTVPTFKTTEGAHKIMGEGEGRGTERKALLEIVAATERLTEDDLLKVGVGVRDGEGMRDPGRDAVRERDGVRMGLRV